MKLELSADVPFSPRQVFWVYRDRLPEMVALLPNILGVEVTSRQEEGPFLHQVNRWRAGAEVPQWLQGLVKHERFEWDEHISWNQEALTAEWRTVVPAFAHAVKARGIHRLETLGEKTRLLVRGELQVDASVITQVPRLLARSVGPLAERFLLSALRQNFQQLTSGITHFLKHKAPFEPPSRGSR